MLARLLRCRSGVGAVEFAVMLPVLVLLMVAVGDFGLAVNDKMRLTSAARAGAQAAVSAAGDPAAVAQAVRQASALAAAELTIASQKSCACLSGAAVACDGSCADGNGVRDFVSVSVSKTWTPVLASPLLDASIPLTATVVLRVK